MCPESGPAPPLESTLKDDDSSNPLNPFDEPEPELEPELDPNPEQPEYKNPFDEPEPEPESFLPKGSTRKIPRPVDMSKYLYADSSKTEEAEELDEWVGDVVMGMDRVRNKSRLKTIHHVGTSLYCP